MVVAEDIVVHLPSVLIDNDMVREHGVMNQNMIEMQGKRPERLLIVCIFWTVIEMQVDYYFSPGISRMAMNHGT